jgi:hypothetical protein
MLDMVQQASLTTALLMGGGQEGLKEDAQYLYLLPIAGSDVGYGPAGLSYYCSPNGGRTGGSKGDAHCSCAVTVSVAYCRQ